MVDMKARYTNLYKYGEAYLKNMTPSGVDLEKYYLGDQRDYKSLDDIFIQFIHSAQNYQSMPNVIAFDKRKAEIGDLLCGFNHKKVSEMEVEKLYSVCSATG